MTRLFGGIPPIVALLGLLLVCIGPLSRAHAQLPAVALDAATASAAQSAAGAAADASSIYIPDVSKFLPAANSPESLSSSLQVLLAMTLLTLAPSIVLMMTCFVRMVVVLALLRQAIGTQMLPPSQVITGLAIFLTILAMAPTWEKVRSTAVQPYLRGETTQMQAITTAGEELRGFMFAQIEAADNVEDVYMMYEYATQKTLAAGETIEPASVPLTALIPAFLLSELKASFVIGFRIYLPFLVVDLVIATILVAMGMMMLPPVVISLPFKLLLFVLADGWHLVAGALLASVAN
jgi:flagellar biosynthetic protein FliP